MTTTDTQSLGARTSLSFSDVDEQASALSGWNQQYEQLSAGRFEGGISHIESADIKLFVEHVGQRIFQTGSLANNVLALGVPLHASDQGVFCGSKCDRNAVHVFSGQSGFEFCTSRNHTMLGVQLRVMDQSSVPIQADLKFLPEQDVNQLRNYLLELMQHSQTSPGILANAAVMASIEDQLLDLLAKPELPNAATASARMTAHWAVVQKAMEQVQDPHGDVPSVSDLCQRTEVSRRTLQNAFHNVLGLSPLAYVKAARLNQARRKLKQLHSVTDAATECGFWHFGHFSHDYFAMFGELPSQTWRRHH